MSPAGVAPRIRTLAVLVALAVIGATVGVGADHARAVDTGVNLVVNPSMGLADSATPGAPMAWNARVSGAVSASSAWATSGAHTGNRYLRTAVASRTSGGASWAPASIAVVPGASYSYGEWYRSDRATAIVVEYVSSAGATTAVRVADLPPAATWTQAVVSVAPPAGTVRLTPLHVISDVGTLDVDDASLVQAGVTTPVPPPTPTTTPATTPATTPVTTPATTTTTSAAPTTTPAAGVPVTPVAVVSSTSVGSLTVSWGAVPGATAYSVAVGPSGVPMTVVTGVTGTARTVTGLGSGTYYASVRATTSSGASRWSTQVSAVVSGPPVASGYDQNLALIRSAGVRNRNEDASPYRTTRSADLVPAALWGPRSDYLPDEKDWPETGGGIFRAHCEFSHFSYDDPLVYPGQPGKAHLHAFFGNTDVNAYSTYDTLVNSGGSTCNGKELNRTSYWVPAMFDAAGNVRVPDGLIVYYKGKGTPDDFGKVIAYPPGMAVVADHSIDMANDGQDATWRCQRYDGGERTDYMDMDMPVCDGNRYPNGENGGMTLMMNVKFPQCWNGLDPTNWTDNLRPRSPSWWGSACPATHPLRLPFMEFYVKYKVKPGETTAGWYLSSDVDRTTLTIGRRGAMAHADWWGGWHAGTNQQWLDGCTNYRDPSGLASGCAAGYLSNGGPDQLHPYPGPALVRRSLYTANPGTVPGSTVFRELCPGSTRTLASPAAAAYCKP